MALDVEECRRLLEAAADAERAGRVFQIGLQRRYSQRYRRSIRYIQSGEAGRILFVRAQWHTGAKTVGDKLWMFRREKSGDMVVEQACHQFDVCNWLFGAPPLRACGFGGTLCRDGEPPGRDTMDHYGAVLEYPGGGKVHLSHLTFAVPERRFAGIHELVFCERAGVDLGNALAWNAAGETVELARVPGELARIPGSGGNETSAVAEGGSETQLAVEGFLHAIETGRPPEADARAGAAATLAALLCRRAIESARPVSWSELGAG
jgi:predicted dehydrogenase